MGMPTVNAPSISASGLRAFESIADRWKLSVAERSAILGLSPSTYRRVRSRSEASLDRNALERISHVLGIYKALHVLFSDDQRADTWIDRNSIDFGDRPARERLTTGLVTDLVHVRRYLDAARGW